MGYEYYYRTRSQSLTCTSVRIHTRTATGFLPMPHHDGQESAAPLAKQDWWDIRWSMELACEMPILSNKRHHAAFA
eukprot:scaffold362072_cov18-Prasinocladus_malaysianus.AAC.1